MSSSETDREPATVTKLGTADFRDRVITGYVHHAESDSIILRQLFPGSPVDIGVIDQIEATTGQVTIYPAHRRAWTATDRAALAGFFVHRWHDRRRAFGAPAPRGAAHG
ncbi:hypothetical protein [Glycomyces salinus]|uniref:hypothetical protein n=1 Tax=Glycomyces salinus TaxID=980294 RepID=UPI0018EAC48E|nr:hypothetical protein [Glycomyces salinus]